MQNALVEDLFSKYFENEKNIAEHSVLVESGTRVGIGNADEVRKLLVSDEMKEIKDAVVEEADILKRFYRVTGVPFFILSRVDEHGNVEDVHRFSGAHDAEVFVDAFQDLVSRGKFLEFNSHMRI